MQYVFGVLMTLTALFLILLVLIQRGKGGGLAGAFGGMGGQSAFGTKAGDAFTKITIGASVFWLLLNISAVRFLGRTPGAFGTYSPPAQTQVVPRPGDTPLLPGTGLNDPDQVDGQGLGSEDPAADGLGAEALDGDDLGGDEGLLSPGASSSPANTPSETGAIADPEGAAELAPDIDPAEAEAAAGDQP